MCQINDSSSGASKDPSTPSSTHSSTVESTTQVDGENDTEKENLPFQILRVSEGNVCMEYSSDQMEDTSKSYDSEVVSLKGSIATTSDNVTSHVLVQSEHRDYSNRSNQVNSEDIACSLMNMLQLTTPTTSTKDISSSPSIMECSTTVNSSILNVQNELCDSSTAAAAVVSDLLKENHSATESFIGQFDFSTTDKVSPSYQGSGFLDGQVDTGGSLSIIDECNDKQHHLSSAASIRVDSRYRFIKVDRSYKRGRWHCDDYAESYALNPLPISDHSSSQMITVPNDFGSSELRLSVLPNDYKDNYDSVVTTTDANSATTTTTLKDKEIQTSSFTSDIAVMDVDNNRFVHKGFNTTSTVVVVSSDRIKSFYPRQELQTDDARISSTTPQMHLKTYKEALSCSSEEEIDAKIEAAMDLVKSHLTNAVREEMADLRQRIKRLQESNQLLDSEVKLLRQLVPANALLDVQKTLTEMSSKPMSSKNDGNSVAADDNETNGSILK